MYQVQYSNSTCASSTITTGSTYLSSGTQWYVQPAPVSSNLSFGGGTSWNNPSFWVDPEKQEEDEMQEKLELIGESERWERLHIVDTH